MAVTTNARISMSGLATFIPTSTVAASNGAYPHPAILTLATNPTFTRNGVAAAAELPVWYPTAQTLPLVHYMLLCGKVTQLYMSVNGTGYVTASTIAVTCTGVTFGTPVLQTGVISCTLVSGATGLAAGPNIAVADTGGGTGGVIYGCIYGGALIGFWVASGGMGYTAATTLTCAGVTLSPIIVGGVLAGARILTQPGTTFNDPPGVAVASPSGSGGTSGPVGASFLAVVSPAGAVAAVIPWAGGIMGAGTGYVIGSPPAVTSTGSTITANVGTYIASIPVLSSVATFSARPAVTIADSAGGSGTVVIPVMSGPLAGDTVTYSAPVNWYTTASGNAPAAMNAAVANFAGVLEGAAGNEAPMNIAPTMLLGANVGEQPSSLTPAWMGKNLLAAAPGWSGGTGTTLGALDSNGYPTTWTAGGRIIADINGNGLPNNVDTTGMPCMVGVYPVQFTDGNVNTANATAHFLTASYATCTPVSLSGTGVAFGTATISGGAITALAVATGGTGTQGGVIVLSGGGATTNAVVVPIISGGVVTGTHVVNGGAGYTGQPTVQWAGTLVSGSVVNSQWDIEWTANPASTYLYAEIHFANSAGAWPTGFNPWVSNPGNTITSRANAMAPDDNFIGWLTTASGRVPGSLRWMDARLYYSGSLPVIEQADVLYPAPTYSGWGINSPNASSWVQHSVNFVAARYFNPDPSKGWTAGGGDNTYPWAASNKVYGDQAWFAQGPDSYGTYTPVAPTDLGFFIDFGANAQVNVVVELRSSVAHGITTGRRGELSGAAGSLACSQGQTYSAATNLSGGEVIYVYPTGEYTIVCGLYYPASNGNTAPASLYPLTIASTTETAVSWNFQFGINTNSTGSQPAYNVPDAFPAQTHAMLPGCWMHRNIPNGATDALITYLAQQDAAALPASCGVYLEVGNEQWNASPNNETNELYSAMGYLIGDATPGSVMGYPIATGSPIGYNFFPAYEAHCLDVYQAAWVAAGRSLSMTRRLAGVAEDLPTGSNLNGSTQALVTAMEAYGLKFDYICLAPYVDMDVDAPVCSAYMLPGTPGGSAQSYTAAQGNDIIRYHTFYNQLHWSRLGGHAAQLAGYSGAGPTPAIYGYEGAIEITVPIQVPFVASVKHDLEAHPSNYHVHQTYYRACQMGNPTVTGSGLYLLNYYQLLSAPSYEQWMIAPGFANQPGYGATNQFATQIGGPLGDKHAHYANPGGTAQQCVALQAFVDWIDVTGPLVSPATAGAIMTENHHIILMEDGQFLQQE